MHHVKGCMIDFAPDIVLLHCGTNDFKKDLTPQKIAHNILKLAEEVFYRGKRDNLVSGIINRGDDCNTKVQKVYEFLSEIRTRKNVKYIDNGNIGLDMLNRSKLHLNRFGTTQLVKNYRETLKTWRHIEKPANGVIPILKADGPSSPCKTTKNSNISDNKLNAMQENPIDSIRQLKLSKPHKIILGHLNTRSSEY